MKPAVFLDRDGVLNHLVVRDGVPVSPRTLEDFTLIKSAIEAVLLLHNAGFACVVVTNQPDLGRGLLSEEVLSAMNERLRSLAPFDGIYVCGHGGATECECRKPRPGLIHRATEDLSLDLSASWLVGDRWVDIAAADAAGVRSILVEHEFSLSPNSSGSPPDSLIVHHAVSDLLSAVKIMVPSSPR